jgi:tRNA dimethylallyltransferase
MIGSKPRARAREVTMAPSQGRSQAPARARSRVLAALYGPTSSGKTALSVQLARRIELELGRPVVIISADSRQVYRYMDIGTSKTTAAQMQGIGHEMLDVAEPVRKFELEDYTRLARGHIDGAFAAGVVPLVVGGTGVYLSALLDAWEVDSTGAARAALRRDFPPSMAGDAYAMLRRLDRAAADQMHPRNYEAVINTLAAIMADGRTVAGPARRAPARVVLALDPGPRAVGQRVVRTYDDQVRRGLFDEIQSLNDRYDLDRDSRRHGRASTNQVLHTHGYREYFEVAREHGKPVARLTGPELADVRGRVIDHIQRYTRRQRSWLAKLTGYRPVSSADEAFPLIARRLTGDG